jgi:glycosyltransferase involved in cell wall biosynthesis
LRRLDDNIKRVGAIMRSFTALGSLRGDRVLLIAGTGPDEGRLQALASSLDPRNIRMLGWVGDVDARCALYAAADLLLLPSISEGFPSVVGESMACGTPVLGSNVGGIPELVREGETGWLVPPGDDAALLAAMQRALLDPGACTRMRPAARSIALARVAPAVVGNQLRKVFRQAGVAHG